MSEKLKTDRPHGEVRRAVEERYAAVAEAAAPCCGGSETEALERTGYSNDELADIPEEALMGLGCGNPVALADLQAGETVVDLGSGGGIDVFLAARRVGDAGRVIGVDMTPAMLRRAHRNAERLGLGNVEFREGIIEDLPLEDGSADVLISNCVINLSPDKPGVFAEAFRVLRPGGRMIVSDIVASGSLPDEARRNPDLWAACIGGAEPEEDYLHAIAAAGFDEVEVLSRQGTDDSRLSSITVRADKPRG